VKSNTLRIAVDDSLLESAARCLDSRSVRALASLELQDKAKQRLDVLAEKANEGQLSPQETREYDRFIEVGDILATLRLKADRYRKKSRR
jgi:hypothetical protein